MVDYFSLDKYKGWIIGAGNHTGRKKEYIISDLGKQMVKNEIERLGELLRNGKNITGGNDHE